ncbi:uncharacterized protein TNCV_322471 [Trichonephila clavipes]|nr:uncharacterized protein TNCV_322471 [Trichonephila clavipes]
MKRRRPWAGVKRPHQMSFSQAPKGRTKCPSARRLRMVREDTGAPNEDAIYAWMVADEAVGCTRAFPTLWRSSRRLVCRGRPEPRPRVNDISRIHWSQHFITTHSERPN